MISIGTAFLLLQVTQIAPKAPFSDLTNSSLSNLLRIKVFGGFSHGKSLTLDPIVCKQAVLGRTDECDIIVDDSILSKKHCTFSYDAPKQTWMINDGFNIRSSMNGTWIYLS